MSDCPNEITKAAAAIVKRLYPDTLSGSERNGIIRRIEAQIAHYIEPLRARDRAAAFREAGNLVVKEASGRRRIDTIHLELWALSDAEEARAKGVGT